MTDLSLPQPYLLFMGDVTEPAFAKTAYGLRDWAPDRCVGEYGLPTATLSAGLPVMSPAEARAAGAKAVVIGVAPVGGRILGSWIPYLKDALVAGLDLISGMHTPLAEVDELRQMANALGRRLIDVRKPPGELPIATGRKRSGKRILTVGTDCALGKKYTALSIARVLKARGVDADFRASGQTGIMIAGAGMPMDAVVADFMAGAAELLSPAADPDHWDVVEGQGSLSHPSYAGVSLALLHGSQPDVIVVCHQPGRIHMVGLPDCPVPTIEETIALNLLLASRVNPAVRCGGVALNTSHMAPAEAQSVIADISLGLRLPVADPIRGGEEFERLVTACVAVEAVVAC